MLDRIANRNGLPVIETPVGFKYIGEALREKGCILGGEESGGMSIMGHIPEKDGILACLLAVEMLAYTGKSLQELSQLLRESYGLTVNERIDIKVSKGDVDIIKEKINEFAPKALAGVKVQSVNDLDGRQVILEDGSWALIRFSGTEIVFRVYIETFDESRLEEIKKEVLGSTGLYK